MIATSRIAPWVALVALSTILGCSAPVRIAAYPGRGVRAVASTESCEAFGFRSVAVLGTPPVGREYEEIGYMTLAQSSTSEFVYSSVEKQIDVARIKACEWGADAIIILGSQSGKGNTWTAFGGLQYHDERESRITAIRYVEPPPKVSPAAAEQPDLNIGELNAESRKREAIEDPPRSDPVRISYEIAEAGLVAVEIVDSNGSVVRSFPEMKQEAGSHQILWDQCDSSGAVVSPGRYAFRVYQVVAGGRLDVGADPPTGP